MSAMLWVDGLFAAFCDSFSGALRDEARRLSFTLGFAPDPLVPWSHVFSHEVTLAAPLMIAEAMPGVDEGIVEHALFAHVLGVIAAMGSDRVEDGQVTATPALLKVLAAARSLRDEHLVFVAGERELPFDPAAADREMAEAIALEREILFEGRRVHFDAYEALSARKQAAGLVASAALAMRAGWDLGRQRDVCETLLDVGLGLQLYDDVVDWEDDAADGRSWALVLARSQGISAPTPPSDPPDPQGLRAEVHAANVLLRMLQGSESRFLAASRRATALGAKRLGRWAQQRADFLSRLAEREEKTAGYVNRAHALAPWARTVLV